MIPENESDHLVKFKNGIHAPDEEASKGIKFLQITKNDFHVVTLDRMVGLQHRQKIVEL